MSKSFNYDRAAKVLCDAAAMGDRACSEKWGVTTKTIKRYRSRLNCDPLMSQFVQQYRKLQNEHWVDQIPAAIVTGLHFLSTSFDSLQPGDAKTLIAVTKAVQVLGELLLTFQALDDRITPKKTLWG
jgi:hypothetical protein